jgi:hypothetical protein
MWIAQLIDSEPLTTKACPGHSRKTAADPSCTTASGPYLGQEYGFGPPATIWRHRGAEHRRPRKCLGANGMR